eukprot:12935308-Prorocentrum_lima.AAC.1
MAAVNVGMEAEGDDAPWRVTDADALRCPCIQALQVKARCISEVASRGARVGVVVKDHGMLQQPR